MGGRIWFVTESKSVRRKFNKNLCATSLLSEMKRNEQILTRTTLFQAHFFLWNDISPFYQPWRVHTANSLDFIESLFSFVLHLLKTGVLEKPEFSLKRCVFKCLMDLKLKWWILDTCYNIWTLLPEINTENRVKKTAFSYFLKWFVFLTCQMLLKFF